MGRGAEIGVVPDKAAHKIRPRGSLPCVGGWENTVFCATRFWYEDDEGTFFSKTELMINKIS